MYIGALRLPPYATSIIKSIHTIQSPNSRVALVPACAIGILWSTICRLRKHAKASLPRNKDTFMHIQSRIAYHADIIFVIGSTVGKTTLDREWAVDLGIASHKLLECVGTAAFSEVHHIEAMDILHRAAWQPGAANSIVDGLDPVEVF